MAENSLKKREEKKENKLEPFIESDAMLHAHIFRTKPHFPSTAL